MFMMTALNYTTQGDPRYFPPAKGPNATEVFGEYTGAYPYTMPSPPYFGYSDLCTTSTGNVLTAPELAGSADAHAALVLPLASAQSDALATRRRGAGFVPSLPGTAAAVSSEDATSAGTRSTQLPTWS